MKKITSYLYQAAVKTINDDGVEHAGYMSFMVLLSFFPFVVFFLVATSIVGASKIGTDFLMLLINSLPTSSTASLRSHVYELTSIPPQRLMTLALFGSIWTASSFVEALRTILNRIYKVESPPTYLWRRLLSILQFLLITLSLFFTMLMLVIIPLVLKKVPEINIILNELNPVWDYWRYFLIFMSLLLAASTLYYMIPNIKLKFIQVIPGSLLTVTLWLLSGNLLFKYIVYYNQLNIIYGSLGSIIITLLFFYIINMIFIYGAEFNYLISQKGLSK